MDSILVYVKSLLGIVAEYDVFDPIIIGYINNAFSILSQLGIGPKGGFYILDSSALWSDYEISGEMLESVKMFVYLKTKILFDPPANSFTLESLNNQAKELEWRLHVDSDPSIIVNTTEE